MDVDGSFSIKSVLVNITFPSVDVGFYFTISLVFFGNDVDGFLFT